MTKVTRFGAPLFVAAAFAGMGAAAEGPKGPVENRGTRVHFDDARVRVQEVRYKPGDQGPKVPRPFRVVRVVEGGAMERVYADGRTEKVVYKTGDVKVYEAEAPFIPRNVGTTDIVLYVVALKNPPR